MRESIRDLHAVYLYGSVITDDFKQDSDLDIAFKSPSCLNNQTRWRLQEELAARFNRDVDLLDLENSSLVMQFEVISKGTRIFCAEENEIEAYETLIFSRYLDFNQIRKLIIKSILSEGSVYGA